MIERRAGALAEVSRMAEAAAELERRVQSCTRDVALMRDQRERLLQAVAEGQKQMDADVGQLEGLRTAMIRADQAAMEIKQASERQEDVIRDARRAVDALRALVAEVDVMRATAESDLTHLAQQSIDTVNATLDQIREQVAEMEAAGQIEPNVRAIRAAEAIEVDEEEDGAEPAEPAEPVEPVHMTAEEAIAELREKIDRMGPVNMMAIEAVERARRTPWLPDQPAPGSRRLDRPDQRGDQQDRRDDARAVPRSVQRHQQQLPADVLDAVRRRQGVPETTTNHQLRTRDVAEPREAL